MSLCRFIRRTDPLVEAWPDGWVAAPAEEEDAPSIGEFLLETGHVFHPDCGRPMSIPGAVSYVSGFFDNHRHDSNYALSLEASTVLRDMRHRTIRGVCLIGGGGTGGLDFSVFDIDVDPNHRHQRLGTRLIYRALSVLYRHNIPTLDTWLADNAKEKKFFLHLGFQPAKTRV